MHLWLRSFFRNEQGQDLAEYALIVGFIAVVAGVVFASSGSSIARIWSTTSSITSSANVLLSGGASATATAQHR